LTRIEEFNRIRRANFAHFRKRFAEFDEYFVAPTQLDGLDPVWMAFAAEIVPTAPFERADLQEHLDARGIVTRTVWSGNITRHPVMRGRNFRLPPAGLANTDAVMERHFMLPCHQGMSIADVDRICDEIAAFATGARP
jgi:CDP-6-deoxy-D-xylo-4-hexulose-3-dehydrase